MARIPLKSSLSIVMPVARLAGRFSKLIGFLESLEPGQVELIIVLDEQDEATTQELDSIILKYDSLNIDYIKGHYGSPGYARNAGLELVNTEWVWFCDADDEPLANIALSSIYEAPNEVDAVIFNYSRVHEIYNREVCFPGALDQTSVAINPGLWRMVIKRKVINDTRFENFALGEDQLFIIDIKLFNQRLLFVPKVVYKYSYGGEGHLVDRRDKVDDLSKVIRKTFAALEKQEGSPLEALVILASRQVLTIMKIGSNKLRIETAVTILSHLLKNPKEIPHFLNASKAILKDLRSS